jgi:hypothetical protein
MEGQGPRIVLSGTVGALASCCWGVPDRTDCSLCQCPVGCCCCEVLESYQTDVDTRPLAEAAAVDWSSRLDTSPGPVLVSYHLDLCRARGDANATGVQQSLLLLGEMEVHVRGKWHDASTARAPSTRSMPKRQAKASFYLDSSDVERPLLLEGASCRSSIGRNANASDSHFPANPAATA